MSLLPHLVLLILPDKQRGHMCWKHVLKQQAVQILPGLDLILFDAIFILEQEVLARAGFILPKTRRQENVQEDVIHI